MRSIIKVQSTAVSGIKSKINTSRKQSKKKTKDLPLRPAKQKRGHNISKVIARNVPLAKKEERSIQSSTKHFKT